VHPGIEMRSAEETLEQAPYLVLSAAGALAIRAGQKRPDSSEVEPLFQGNVNRVLANGLNRRQLDRVILLRQVAGGLLGNRWLDAPELVWLDMEDANVWDLLEITPGYWRGGWTFLRFMADQVAFRLAGRMPMDSFVAVQEAILDNIERGMEGTGQQLAERLSMEGLSDRSSPFSVVDLALSRWEEDLAILSFLSYARGFLETTVYPRRGDALERIEECASRVLLDLAELARLKVPSQHLISPPHVLPPALRDANWQHIFPQTVTSYDQIARRLALREMAGLEARPTVINRRGFLNAAAEAVSWFS